jgi:hypothetical protein
MDWHCITHGTQRGPMSFEDLQTLHRDGVLQPDDYVWNETFGDQWRRAREVPALTVHPPALPVTPPAPTTPLTGQHGQRPFFAIALHQAWDHMRQTLLRPARFARWMGLAFCVWLAMVGLNEPYLAFDILAHQAEPDPELLQQIQSSTTPEQILGIYQEMVRQVMENVQALLTPDVIQTALAIWLLLLLATGWLRARGAFMVMHRWLHADAPISQSWAMGAAGLGRSLFLFRSAVGVALFALTALLGQDFLANVWQPLLNSEPFIGPLATRAFVLSLAFSLLATVWFTVAILTTHFVVPIMYWRRVGVLDAWRVVLEFCNEQPAALTIYLTMYILLLHVVMFALLVGACCTCGCINYLLLIPFLNGLLCLPATFFFRGLGISFLRQWRPDLETTVPQSDAARP